MASFAYRAIDEEGHIQNGNIDAVNGVDLELRLKRMGLDLIKFDSIKKSTLFGGPRITRKELITFCFHLDQLMRAGVPIIDALADLRDSVDSPAFRQIVASLLEDIEGGLRLSDAMANHSEAFDTVFVALIRTGETAGQLPDVLTKLTENLKWQDELGAQVKKAMIYPIASGIVIFGVVLILMIFLVPQLGTTLKQLTPNPPPQTLALIAVSAWMQKFWYIVVALPIIIIGTIFFLVKTNDNVKYQIDAAILKLVAVFFRRQVFEKITAHQLLGDRRAALRQQRPTPNFPLPSESRQTGGKSAHSDLAQQAWNDPIVNAAM